MIDRYLFEVSYEYEGGLEKSKIFASSADEAIAEIKRQVRPECCNFTAKQWSDRPSKTGYSVARQKGKGGQRWQIT